VNRCENKHTGVKKSEYKNVLLNTKQIMLLLVFVKLCLDSQSMIVWIYLQ
jgi:hypothetical protein